MRGGVFTTYNPGSQSANYIAKLDSSGNLDTTFSPPASNGFNTNVRTLAVSGTDIYVGGNFNVYRIGSEMSAVPSFTILDLLNGTITAPEL